MLLILSVCLLPLWPQETVTPVKPLSARIDALIEHKLPAGSNVAISVYDLTAGKPLYGYQADKLSRPASTMKLLTTITALSRPEADEPFRTEVWYQGTIERDTLQGNMYVIAVTTRSLMKRRWIPWWLPWPVSPSPSSKARCMEMSP